MSEIDTIIHSRAWKLKEGHPSCDLLTHSEIQDAVDQVNAEQQRADASAIPEQAVVNFQVGISDG